MPWRWGESQKQRQWHKEGWKEGGQCLRCVVVHYFLSRLDWFPDQRTNPTWHAQSGPFFRPLAVFTPKWLYVKTISQQSAHELGESEISNQAGSRIAISPVKLGDLPVINKGFSHPNMVISCHQQWFFGFQSLLWCFYGFHSDLYGFIPIRSLGSARMRLRIRRICKVRWDRDKICEDLWWVEGVDGKCWCI